MTRLVGVALLALGLAPVALVARQGAPRPSSARIAPLAEPQWTQRHRDLVASYVRGPVTNDIRVLLNHPESLPGVMPFWNYVVSESTLAPRDRQILMLRTAWLSNSSYVWAKYATGAPDDVRRIASGPTDDGVNAFDGVLLRSADGLHRASFVDDATWQALTTRYGTEQLMDAVFTVAETSMLAMVMNAVRAPVDQRFTVQASGGRGPHTGPGIARDHPVLAAPRIPPLRQTFWTGELRALLDPDGTGRDIAAVYRTFARHPALYAPRQALSEYIRLQSTLPARTRELAILRIGYWCRSDYEWGAHARAGLGAGLTDAEIRRIATQGRSGWSGADAAVLAAVDELYADDAITDATWAALAAHFDTRQLLDLLITTGGYRMVSMALNTFGVPLEAASETLPR